MVGSEGTPGLTQFAADMFHTALFPPTPQAFTCSARDYPCWTTCPIMTDHQETPLSRVNFEKRMVHVCRTVVKKQIAERIKTKKKL